MYKPSANEIYKSVASISKPNDLRPYITLDSLDTFKCIKNTVLVRIDVEEYEKIGSCLVLGDEAYDNSSNRYNVSMHAVRHGIIVKQVDKFLYHEKGLEDHRTEIETKIGDDVFFPAGESENCPLFMCDGIYYILLRYEALYLAKRLIPFLSNSKHAAIINNHWYDVIMLNGYLLCNRVTKEQLSDHIILTDGIEVDKRYADVVFSGKPVEYRSHKALYGGGINNGDRITFTNWGNEVMLEDPIHLFFDGKNEYRVIQRRFVMGVIKE